MDISGLRALEQVVEDLSLEGRQVVLAAASQSVLELLIRSELFSDPEHGLLVYGTLKAALDAPLPTPVQVEVVEPAVPAPAKTKVRAQAVPAPKKRRAGAAKKADAPKPVRSPKAPKART
jgi:hypothetical protein